MKRLSVLVLSLALASCQTVQEQTPEPPTGVTMSTRMVGVMASDGAAVALRLNARYNDVRADCGKASMPAFLCSGIVLRSTVPSFTHEYSTWNPSPHSQTSGGVSFSYLRKDLKFKNLVFGQTSGFIFYPVLDRPAGTRQIQILCAYPADGATQLRAAPGCGAHPYAPEKSRLCGTIGVETAEQWLAHRKAAEWNRCAFDVSDAMNMKAANSFYQAIRAHNLMGYFAGRYDYSELILATWPQNIPNELPIESFYYLEGGLAGAQHDQKDFFDRTGGKVIPIIKLTLPTTSAGDALFTYSAADQVK